MTVCDARRPNALSTTSVILSDPVSTLLPLPHVVMTQIAFPDFDREYKYLLGGSGLVTARCVVEPVLSRSPYSPMSYSTIMPTMPDTMKKRCALFPILVLYKDWRFTRDLDRWNEKLRALAGQDSQSIIRNMLDDDFMKTFSANDIWFAAFRGREPGIYYW